MEDVTNYVKIAAYLGAAFAIGIGCIGPSLAQGLVGSKACETIGKYPEAYSKVRLAMIVSLGIIEASCVYVLLIAVTLIFRA